MMTYLYMENIREKHLRIAKDALEKLYTTHRGAGLLSVYLWGSILRDEYAPGVSDVDALGITDDNFPDEDADASNSFLQERAPELYDFRINFVQFSELNGATPVTHLAKVTPAPLMVMLFPDWEYVCGNQYQLSDFVVKAPTYEQAICLSMKVLDDFYVLPLTKGDFKKFKSVVKRMMHICYFMNQIEKGHQTFSYLLLKQNMNEQTREVLELLFRIKEQSYRSPTKNELDTVLRFLDSTRRQYCISNHSG